MHPLYDFSSEQRWLQHLIAWSRKQEKATGKLQNELPASPEKADQLNQWQERFARFRKLVENRYSASLQGIFPQPGAPGMPQLLRESHHLLDTFSRFLSDEWLDSYQAVRTQAINRPEENSPESEETHIEEEKRFEEERQPVPIGQHTLPPLPYPYHALERYIDEKTMRLHHDKHHRSYVEGLNKAEKEMAKARKQGDFSLIKHWEREAAFNGAGHYLHTLFWKCMKPGGGGKATGAIAREISRTFGGFQQFKRHFSAAAEKVEGGGWALLVWAPRAHRVEILQAEKHQNLSQQDMIPLLVLDVWEHAYYLKYNNDRKKYVDAWWNVVNWNTVNHRFQQARKVTWKPY